MHYRGRFAPSPTGPLHFGSLLAALASYCDAKAAGGKWLLRIDDIDPLREQAGASSAILKTLEQHGLYWDEQVLYQSTRTEAYRHAIAALQQQGLLFYCTCSRQQLAQFGNRYPGTCRHRLQPPAEAFAIRVKVPDHAICLDDQLQGRYCQNLAEQGGDFILVRKEGFFSYHLACIVDEDYLGITHIVRGVDLLESTPKQIFLAERMQLKIPIYAHIPVVLSPDGVKLSKQTGARALDPAMARQSLVLALRCLGQPLVEGIELGSVEEILSHAVKHWSLHRVPPHIDLTTA